MTTIEKIRSAIINEYNNNAESMDWSYRAGLAKALDIIKEYAEQEKDAYDKVLEYLKANVDDFPDYHEAIEAVLKMKGGE